MFHWWWWVLLYCTGMQDVDVSDGAKPALSLLIYIFLLSQVCHWYVIWSPFFLLFLCFVTIRHFMCYLYICWSCSHMLAYVSNAVLHIGKWKTGLFFNLYISTFNKGIDKKKFQAGYVGSFCWKIICKAFYLWSYSPVVHTPQTISVHPKKTFIIITARKNWCAVITAHSESSK